MPMKLKKKQADLEPEEKRSLDGNETESSQDQNEEMVTKGFIEGIFKRFQERDAIRDSAVQELKMQNREFERILQETARENSERLFQIERNLLRAREGAAEPDSPLLQPADVTFRREPIPTSLQTLQRTEQLPQEESNRGGQRMQQSEIDPLRTNVNGEEDQGSIRRNSFYGRILVENTTLEDPDRRKLTVESEEHRKIVWKEESVDGFLDFLQKIYHFIKSYDQRVPNIFTHLSEDIQQLVTGLLFSQKSTRYKDMQDIYSASISDIHDVAKVLFAPRDMIQFVECLAESCAPYAVEMKQREYARARTELYSLRQKFEERYEFLAEGAATVKRNDVIPSLTFKPGGILRVWMRLTPQTTRASFEAMLQSKKFANLQAFFTAYFVLVDDTNEKMEQARILDGRLQAPARISFIQSVEEDYLEEEESNQFDEDFQSIQNTPRFNNRGSWQEKGGRGSGAWQGDARRQSFSAQGRPSRTSNSTLQHEVARGICQKLLLYDKCVDTPERKCPYLHTPQLVREEREKIKNLWDNPRHQFKRDVRPPPGPPPGRAKDAVSAIQSDEQEEEDLSMVHSFMQVEKTNPYWRAAHREAMVNVGKADALQRVSVMTLFDTGASSSNFISRRFVIEHGLESKMVKANKRVKVANGEKVLITSKIFLEVTFAEKELKHKATLEFLIMDGLSMELIIGLPDICNHFHSLLFHMIGKLTEMKNRDNLSQLVEFEERKLIDPELLESAAIPPWMLAVPSVSEEDVMIPEPGERINGVVSQEDLEKSRSEFLSQLESRVCPAFSNTTTVVDFLRTEGLDVFVPVAWEGVKGIEPIRLEYKGDPPGRLKPPGRRIPAAIFEASKKEFRRMMTYFYVPSTSPITSPIVVAPKATSPYVRICGDYRLVNKLIKVFNYPIPEVLKELHKASDYSVFVDLDVRNAFHNIPLHPETSAMLSVQTPFGQFEPLFLPEGVAPASGVLMSTMTDIFSDCGEWLIVIWDNILICASDYEDAFEKLRNVVRRCKERNVFLKLSKSWFGFESAEFFGYLCKKGNYRLTEERMKAVTDIPFPAGHNKLKKMQQFLGSAVYFKPFVMNYSTKTAPLTEMTLHSFSWDEKTWKTDYHQVFDSFKQDILHSFTLYHPNYRLPWFLYVDASDVAMGGVLIQVTEGDQQQVIAFVSRKFTASAARWSVIEKECFAMFYSCSKLRYYLFAKNFTMLTDHNNLLWMESSEVPKIVRMRIFLQEFNFTLIHVAGKENVFADWLSRMHEPGDVVSGESSELLKVLNEDDRSFDSEDVLQATLRSVHNSRMGHHGAYRTWLLLNRHHPGHAVSMSVIQDYVRECVFCQKVRNTMRTSLVAPTRAIVAEHPRHLCGYDTLYITPADSEGFQYLHVFKMIPSRLVALYPSKTLSAESLASAAFQFFVTYGITDILITDPGSNITSEVVKLLLGWFGIRLRISLTNRHQSNMVERTHREILRFLSILVNSEGLKKAWSKPHVLGIVQFLLNSEISSETGVTPFEYTFGSTDFKHIVLPKQMDDTILHSDYLRMLNADLSVVRMEAKRVQEMEQQKRRTSDAENSYVTGDYILFDEASKGFRHEKLKTRYSGPYVIIAVYKADITCKHIVTSKLKVFHMDDVKLFIGSAEDAYKAAQTDDDQYVIRSIVDHRGDPEKRSLMSFLVLFEDDDRVWLEFNADFASTAPYELYCRGIHELEPLTMSEKEWKKYRSQLNSQGVIGAAPGDTCYVDLKAWGEIFYWSVGLAVGVRYMVKCEYKKWTGSRKKKIDLYCPLFKQTFDWDATAVRLYGRNFELEEGMVLVDAHLIKEFPKLME